MSDAPPLRLAVGIDESDLPDGIAGLSALGADEFFAGYVPPEWSDRYGWEIGLNRRVFGPDQQFRSTAALDAAVRAAHGSGRRVFVTFNAHDHHAQQMPELRRIVLQACELGPDALIVADPALLELLAAWRVSTPVHLSVGAGCFNGRAVRHFCDVADVRRVVLPRKMSPAEMRTMIEGLADLRLEFEALAIGYRCLFNDEYCFTRHSGATELFCESFVPDPRARAFGRLPRDWKDVAGEAAAAPAEQFREGSALDRLCTARGPGIEPPAPPCRAAGADCPGLDGGVAANLLSHCALCAIGALRDAGVGVLKIPVRGSGWQKRRHVELVRAVADHPDPTREYCRALVGSAEFCDTLGSCYYSTRAGGNAAARGEG